MRRRIHGFGSPPGPPDEIVEQAGQPYRFFATAVGVLLWLDGVEVAPPGVAIPVPPWMQHFHRDMPAPQLRSVDNQALAVAVR
jgi:hypothetical protein